MFLTDIVLRLIFLTLVWREHFNGLLLYESSVFGCNYFSSSIDILIAKYLYIYIAWLPGGLSTSLFLWLASVFHVQWYCLLPKYGNRFVVQFRNNANTLECKCKTFIIYIINCSYTKLKNTMYRSGDIQWSRDSRRYSITSVEMVHLKRKVISICWYAFQHARDHKNFCLLSGFLRPRPIALYFNPKAWKIFLTVPYLTIVFAEQIRYL
jgi:hypothetical protein